MDEPVQRLPVASTKLFGREKDIAALSGWLQRADVRLVTITGLPGIGKTRLAVEVATALRDDFADGAVFVPLNAISDPALVVTAVAEALHVRESGTASVLDNLKAHLRDRQMLLLLDNFEQVLSAAMAVAELLAESNRLKILVTSRTALHLSSEYEYSLSPLLLAELNHLPPLADLARLPSVAMFVARAQAVKPDFVLTHANAATVAQVCNRLDGLPLAIELAAARAKVLPPQALLSRLTHPLSLLANGARDLPPRHQTLHRALEWSYELLSENEQRLFTRMAVFNGGASIEAAETVCHLPDDPPAQILYDLSTLLDHSLLQASEAPDGEPRFTMLEMIREFALEQLVVVDELVALQKRHANYYLKLAERAEPEFQGTQQAEWLERLESEHDNFRAVLYWTLESDPLAALTVSAALWYFWFLRAYYSEGRTWLERALNATAGLEAPNEAGSQEFVALLAGLRAKALHGIGTIAYYQSDYSVARAWLEESLSIRRSLGDLKGAASTLNNLGNLAHDVSDLDLATALYTESLQLRTQVGDEPGVAASLSNLGNLALYRGDYVEAGDLYSRSLSIRRNMGNKISLSIALNNLGIVALHQGNYGRAALLYEEGLALDQELGNRNGEASIRNNLGELALYQGDYRRADEQFALSLAVRQELGDRWGTASVLTNMGASALHQGDYGRAVALLEESLVLKRETGDRWSIANSLELLGRAALHLGDLDRAESLLRESLTLRIALADKSGTAISLAELAGLVAARGNAVWTARLMAVAGSLMELTGTNHGLAVGDLAEYQRTRASAQGALPPDALSSAETEGRMMTAEQVLEQLEQVLSPAPEAEGPDLAAQTAAAFAGQKEGLTARESEILRLIARGLSYSQIAEQLVISSRTVDAHLRSIYNKLQVRSRHEATRYALEHHLIEFPL